MVSAYVTRLNRLDGNRMVFSNNAMLTSKPGSDAMALDIPEIHSLAHLIDPMYLYPTPRRVDEKSNSPEACICCAKPFIR